MLKNRKHIIWVSKLMQLLSKLPIISYLLIILLTARMYQTSYMQPPHIMQPPSVMQPPPMMQGSVMGHPPVIIQPPMMQMQQPVYHAHSQFTPTPPAIATQSPAIRAPPQPQYRKSNNDMKVIAGICICVCVCIAVVIAVIWAIIAAIIADNFGLSGYVMNQFNNQGVSNARVVFVDSHFHEQSYEAWSDSYGYYSFKMLHWTAYDVHITRSGYYNYYESFDLSTFWGNEKHFLIRPL
ncbi:hypothetical protein RCL1_001074 [Eukaryota sp. TZLM3-RCL]